MPAPSLGRSAAVSKLRQAPIEIVKISTIAASGVRARLSVQVTDDLRRVGVRQRRDNNPRHYFRSAASRSALRALCSSSVMVSPRSIA